MIARRYRGHAQDHRLLERQEVDFYAGIQSLLWKLASRLLPSCRRGQLERSERTYNQNPGSSCA